MYVCMYVCMYVNVFVLVNQGKYAEAEVLYERATIIWKNAYGPDHPLVATAMNNHAAVMKALVGTLTASSILITIHLNHRLMN